LIRFLLFLILFYIVYWVVKILFRNFSQPSNKTIHNSKPRRRENKYEDIQDAEFKEIKPDDDKKQ